MTYSGTQTGPARGAAKQRLEDLPAPSAYLHQIDPKRLHTQLEAWCHALGPTYTFKLGFGHFLGGWMAGLFTVLNGRRVRRLALASPAGLRVAEHQRPCLQFGRSKCRRTLSRHQRLWRGSPAPI